MARLREYPSLKDKDAYFYSGSSKINTIKEFEDYLAMLIGYGDAETYIFRGCGEAKYKLYTSSQRYWIENELNLLGNKYHNFIKKLIENCKNWNEETVAKFFRNNKIHPNNALAYLSYMQHIGVPTPLIDFTTNPLIGLYFAVESQNHFSSDNEIDNYCSLYVIDKSDVNLVTTTEEFKNDSSNSELSSIEIDYDNELTSYPIMLVETDIYIYRMVNNMRISNQDGLFFFNKDMDKPIEEQYSNVVKENKKRIQNKDLDIQDEKFGICLNIHKNLSPYVLSKLEEEGITANRVFPDDEDLRKYVLEKTLSES